MTPNEISTLVAEALNRQFDIPFRLAVFEKFKLWRSELIKNSIDKKPALKNMYLQSIIVKMAPYSTKGCSDGPNCVDAARTLIPIPLAIKVGVTPYDYVGGVQGNNPYTHAQPTAGRYLAAGKYSGDATFWHRLNGHVIVSNPVVTDVRIDDVFDDPLEAQRLTCESAGLPCDLWNEPYPGTPNDIIRMGVQYVIDSYTQLQTKPDNNESELGNKP